MTLSHFIKKLVNMQAFIYTRLIYTFWEKMVIMKQNIKFHRMQNLVATFKTKQHKFKQNFVPILVPFFDGQCSFFHPNSSIFKTPVQFQGLQFIITCTCMCNTYLLFILTANFRASSNSLLSKSCLIWKFRDLGVSFHTHV